MDLKVLRQLQQKLAQSLSHSQHHQKRVSLLWRLQRQGRLLDCPHQRRMLPHFQKWVALHLAHQKWVQVHSLQRHQEQVQPHLTHSQKSGLLLMPHQKWLSIQTADYLLGCRQKWVLAQTADCSLAHRQKWVPHLGLQKPQGQPQQDLMPLGQVGCCWLLLQR